MSDLNILFPEVEEVAVAGRVVLIKPVELRHFEMFGKAASELLQVVAAGSMDQIHAYAERHSDKLRRALLATTSFSRWRLISRWYVARLPAPVAIQLMLQVIRANANFFAQAQVEAAKALGGLQ